MSRSKKTNLEITYFLLRSLNKKERANLTKMRQKGGPKPNYQKVVTVLSKQKNYVESVIKGELNSLGFSQNQIRNYSRYARNLLLSIKGFDPLNRDNDPFVFFQWAEKLSNLGFTQVAVEVAEKGMTLAEQNGDWGLALQGVLIVDRTLKAGFAINSGINSLLSQNHERYHNYQKLLENYQVLSEFYDEISAYEKNQKPKSDSFSLQLYKQRLTEKAYQPLSFQAEILYLLCKMVLAWIERDFESCLATSTKGIELIQSKSIKTIKQESIYLRFLILSIQFQFFRENFSEMQNCLLELSRINFRSEGLRAEQLYQISTTLIAIYKEGNSLNGGLKVITKLKRNRELIDLLPQRRKLALYLIVSDFLLLNSKPKEAEPWLRNIESWKIRENFPKLYLLGRTLRIFQYILKGNFEQAYSSIAYQLKNLPVNSIECQYLFLFLKKMVKTPPLNLYANSVQTFIKKNEGIVTKKVFFPLEIEKYLLLLTSTFIHDDEVTILKRNKMAVFEGFPL